MIRYVSRENGGLARTVKRKSTRGRARGDPAAGLRRARVAGLIVLEDFLNRA